MPKYGQQQDEGTIVHWLKQVGDVVAKGEPLVEVESDKASFEHEAPESGFLRKIIAEEGATVPVNSVIAVMILSLGSFSGQCVGTWRSNDHT